MSTRIESRKGDLPHKDLLKYVNYTDLDPPVGFIRKWVSSLVLQIVDKVEE